MERRIQEAIDLLDSIPDAKSDINRRRYAAETEYTRKKAERLVFWMDKGRNTTYARSQAELECQDELVAWQATKQEYHELDDLAKALTTQIYAMLNINKSVTAAYIGYRNN